jgi:transmembrane sensor
MEQDLSLLFKKLLNNECSPDELNEVLERLINRERGYGYQLIQEHLAQKVQEQDISAEVHDRLDRKLKLILANDASAKESYQQKHKIVSLVRYAAAASILLFLAAGAYFYFKKQPAQPVNIVHQVVPQADLVPGSNKAILTLSNGKTISLTDAKNGLLVNEGKTAVQKTGNGQLAYDVAAGNPDQTTTPIIYNIVSTPKGGQYQLTLPDGSKVWLNAASSLKFPTAFTANNRDVELSGEAYFEVEKNKAKPFHVISNSQTIEVLGTHFNVNTYTDEPAVKTTLIEGSVKVSGGNNIVMLKPGQQSAVELNGGATAIRVNSDVNTNEVVAWKNGMFEFNNANIETIMRQVSRWYNVDVVYEGKLPAYHFDGEVPRNVNAQQVLQVLKGSGLNFTIDGRRIIVKP